MNYKNQIFIISVDNKPLMPTSNEGTVRDLLKNKEAIIINHNPFTIKLLKSTTEFEPKKVVLGIDPGYSWIGFSAISDGKELFCGQIEQRNDIPKLLETRSKHRRDKRSRKRYRKVRFDNRKKEILKFKTGDTFVLKKNIKDTSFKKYDIVFYSHIENDNYIIYNSNGEYVSIEKKESKTILEKTEKCLAPSIQHKKETIFKIIDKALKILPITHIIIEQAKFDIQKIKNPKVKGEEYQQGEQLNFYNVRQYVLHRDNHKCQNPNCKNKDKNKILQIHHVLYKSKEGTDKPSNLITLCTKCHTPKNHNKGGFLYEWMQVGKKTKGFKPETFMSTINKNIVRDLEIKYPNIEISKTFGYITKYNRIKLEKKYKNKDFKKTHYNDAFIIAGGHLEERAKPIQYKWVRRNDRSLTSFYDAKYIDIRDGSIKSGSELSNGRTTRNKNLNTENLRKYRKRKMKAGKKSNTKQKRPAEKGTIIKITEFWEGTKVFENGRKNFVEKNDVYVSQGCNERNVTIKKGDIKIALPLRICKSIYFQKGLLPVF